MKHWKIPVTWEVCGTVSVEAKTLSEAMEIARDENGEIPCPAYPDYVDGSWQLSTDDENIIRELYNAGQKDNEEYELVELCGMTALFTEERIENDNIPAGLFRYEVRGLCADSDCPVTIERRVIVDFAGTILTAKPLPLSDQVTYIELNGINLTGECMTVDEFLAGKEGSGEIC